MLTGLGSIRLSASAMNRRRKVDFPDELGPDRIIPNGSLSLRSLSAKLGISMMKLSDKKNTNELDSEYRNIV
jgi:hypothetical protein